MLENLNNHQQYERLQSIDFFFSRRTRAQHLTLCVCVVSGVPWMDAMLRSVREERQLYSHNQCVQYMCTHSRGHNIVMNKAGILARVSALHGSPTMAILWPALFLFNSDSNHCEVFHKKKPFSTIRYHAYAILEPSLASTCFSQVHG